MRRITFLVHRGKEYTVRKFLRSWGRDLAESGAVEVRVYPAVAATGRTPWKRLRENLRAWRTGIFREADLDSTGRGRLYVFADLERMRPPETETAERLWQRLAGRPDTERLLNHPERSLRRFDLLKKLHEEGLNDFGVYRLGSGEKPRRWPVFLRREDDHYGSLSKLIHDPEELEREIAGLESRGERLDGVLVVEHVDASDEDGIVRKLGAFRVGERILARHIHFSRRWVVKSPDIKLPETAREEYEYVRDNPHEEALRRVFDVAGVEYGRLDYGLVGGGPAEGRIQVWEINTNPMILIPKDMDDPLRFAAHDLFGHNFVAALEALRGAS